MAAKAGKKGKKKGTTMALTDFLSDETGSSPAPGTSYVLANKQMDWASEMEEADFGDSMESSYSMSAIDRAKLPTAPKAARGPEDLENVPTSPPFTAFIGNLPYEATEEKIREFFRNLPIDNVRLPEDNGRLRGFGYVQFDTRDALIEALLMKDESFGGRKVRIDLAGESQGGDNRQGGRGGRRDDGQPDRTEGDWRRSEVRQEPSFNDRERGGGSQYDDRGPSRYDDRRDDRGGGGFSDRRDDRGGGFDDRRGGGGGFEDRRGGGGYDDRRGGGGFDDRRGGGGFEDRRGGGGYDDRRGGGGYGRRDDRGGGGGGFGRDRFDDRDGGRRQFGSSFQRDDRGEEKAWERGPAPAAGGRDRGYGGDRNDRYGGSSAAGPDSRPVAEAPKERPRLNLQPRTKPVEKSAEDKPSKSASIFGSAKPVDTAQREREIEEKLLKQKDPAPAKSSLESRGYGGSRGYDEPSRDSGPRDSGSRDIRYDQGNKENRSVPSSRRRSGSDDDSRRERRSSGSSRSKKGSVSSQTRSRQDSGEQSQHGDSVFSGGEEDKSHNAVSPALREEPVKLVPAPPPKENIWEKRKTTQTQSPPQKPTEPKAPLEESTISSNQPKSPVNSQSADQSKRQSRNNSQSSQDLTPTKNEVKKDYVPAEPPKQNPWMKRQQERDLTSGKKDGPAPVPAGSQPAVSSAWGGRGGGAGDRGRGRGGRGGGGRGRGEPPRQRPERREKQLPQSVDEMPKMEDKKNRDFSDSNKFAGLMDDEGDSS